jgi:hypothetical protein
MKKNDIVKYTKGNVNYILENINYSEDTAYIKQKDGRIYTLEGISRLELSNISYEEYCEELNIPNKSIENLEGESWKKSIGLDYIYVSNLGRVKICRPNTDEKLMLMYDNVNYSKFIQIKEYLNFKERKKYYDVTLLVANAFIPNPNKYKYINYIDNDFSNCNVTNLEWIKFGEIQPNPTKEDKIRDWISRQPKTTYSKNNHNMYNYDDPHRDNRSINQRLLEDGLDGFEDAIWNID